MCRVRNRPEAQSGPELKGMLDVSLAWADPKNSIRQWWAISMPVLLYDHSVHGSKYHEIRWIARFRWMLGHVSGGSNIKCERISPFI